MADLNRDAMKVKLEFDKKFSGVQAIAQRQDKCLREAGIGEEKQESLMGAASSLYVRTYLTDSQRNLVKTMFDSVMDVFKDSLQQVSWMDEGTKEEALKKANEMTAMIGYYDELKNSTKMNALFQDLQIVPDQYFENTLAIRKFWVARKFQEVGMDVGLKHWTNHMAAVFVGALYQQNGNIVKIPAGIINEAFFRSEWPMYLNYATMSEVLAHEIWHGFDMNGRFWDHKGRMRQWWKTEDAIKAFTEKANCIVEHFGQLKTEDGKHTVNGNQTLNENIAGVGGVKYMHKAYGIYYFFSIIFTTQLHHILSLNHSFFFKLFYTLFFHLQAEI